MAETNNTNKQLVKKQTNLPEETSQMESMHYRPNEASFNYNGITLNINIPVFLDKIKIMREKQLQKKAMKELKKLEQKTMEDVKCYDNVVYEEDILNEEDINEEKE